MTAYVISDVVARDSELVPAYRERARASIEQYDGTYLSQVGDPVESVEGDWAPANIVIVAFPSIARAREWYRSPEYAEALAIRWEARSRNLIFIDGTGSSDQLWSS